MRACGELHTLDGQQLHVCTLLSQARSSVTALIATRGLAAASNDIHTVVGVALTDVTKLNSQLDARNMRGLRAE